MQVGVGAGQVVIVVDVTLGALHRGVRTGQRESGGRVIEGRTASRLVVLWHCWQVCGNPDSHVIRIGRALKIRQVAGDASRVRAGQVVVVIDVALGALQGRVRAGEGKPVVE